MGTKQTGEVREVEEEDLKEKVDVINTTSSGM